VIKVKTANSWASQVLSPFLSLRIGLRLTLAFVGVFVLMVVMAAFATLQMSAANERMAHITEGTNQQIARVNVMIDSVGQRAIAVRNLTMLGDADLKKTERESIGEAALAYAEAEKELLALIDRYNASEGEKALLEAIKRSEQATVALMDEAVTLGMAGRTEEAVSFLMDKVRPRQARWITVLQTLSGLQAKTSSEYAIDTNADYVQSRNILVAFAGTGLLLGMVLAWLVTRSITVPVKEAVRMARTAATGDLTAITRIHRHDEVGDLLDALQAMNQNLTRVVAEVRHGSESIATGTSEIATGNNDLSHRTEQQASSLQETAASMEQLRATVHSNLETARQASSLAERASDAAAKGGSVVGEVVHTMAEITTASKRIADIIGVIDGIAFQTNILALNAAVEAARAGEQGRGFAVVAGEVRSLAQRSASAAREIKSLIGASADSVERGSRLVGNAGGMMDDIVAQVRSVSTLIGQISHANQEQTSGIDQVGDAVSGLDRVTQQNAALVEESAAAAESLKQQAARLLASVSVFKLDERAA
jgi:methyl-accepting chemotaxis protein